MPAEAAAGAAAVMAGASAVEISQIPQLYRLVFASREYCAPARREREGPHLLGMAGESAPHAAGGHIPQIQCDIPTSRKGGVPARRERGEGRKVAARAAEGPPAPVRGRRAKALLPASGEADKTLAGVADFLSDTPRLELPATVIRAAEKAAPKGKSQSRMGAKNSPLRTEPCSAPLFIMSGDGPVLGGCHCRCHRIADRGHVAVVGAAATAQDAHRRECPRQCAVAATEVGNVADVERVRLVELRMTLR